MNDTGWRRNKYGGLFNINDYMNQKIRNSKKDNITTIIKEEFNGQIFKSKYSKNENGQVTGQLDYVEQNGETMVQMIKVYSQFQRNGYATKLLKSLQKDVGNKDINFDILTDDGKKLIDKIGIITKERKDDYGKSHCYGRIK